MNAGRDADGYDGGIEDTGFVAGTEGARGSRGENAGDASGKTDAEQIASRGKGTKVCGDDADAGECGSDAADGVRIVGLRAVAGCIVDTEGAVG